MEVYISNQPETFIDWTDLYEDIRQISELKKTKTYFKPRSRSETLREAAASKKGISWKNILKGF